MTDKDKKAIRLKEQRSAFVMYLESGMEKVRKYFPDAVDFVIANKDKSYEEVAIMIDNAFVSIK